MVEQKVIECQLQFCDCGSMFVSGFYPSHEASEPDEDGESFVMGIVPAWICPRCGFSRLITVEEKMDWLGMNSAHQQRLVRAINIAEHMLTISPELKELMDSQEAAREEGKVH